MSEHVHEPAVQGQRVALVDLLDRVLAGGVVISGDITLSIADVDLVTVSLRALVSSVTALMDSQPGALGGSNDWTALEAYRRSTILRNRCRNRSPSRRQQFYG